MKKQITLLMTLAFLQITKAQTPTFSLLKDINPTGASTGGNRNFTDYNGKMYFVADDGTHGGELWVTDGTTAGTQLVKDINVGSTGSYPDYFVVCNGKMYFNANDGIHGVELWSSDGTAAGTQLVKDIKAGYNDSYPTELTVMNNKIYFSADDSVHAIEPWVSDGTTAGTQLILDINQDMSYQNSDPAYFTAYNNKIYFQAEDQLHGIELWVTDGTAGGTILLKDINTTTSASGSDPMEFCVYNGNLFFKADAGNSGNQGELWMTDGTTAGTVLVKNIYPAGDAEAEHLHVLNGKLYFMAIDGINGQELWMSDGTTSGTALLKDINPGSGSSYGDLFTLFNNKLYFQADDGTDGNELWVTDGTTSGTMLLKDIDAGPGDSYPAYFTALGSKLYFKGSSDLWVTNGTTAGTYSLAPALANSSALGCNAGFCTLNSAIYFNADYDVSNCEVWKLDTTGSLGIESYDKNKYQVSVYPNPGNGEFNVQINTNDHVSIEIYNALGQLVLIKNAETNLTQLNILNLTSGIYNVRVLKSSELIYQTKLIKE